MVDLNKDDGLDLLINKMKKLCTKDSKAAAYLAYEKFELFKRPAEMSIVNYLNESKRLYYDIRRYEMTSLSAVLTYRVLKNANLSNDKQQLTRATIAELSYENMKKHLKAIHDSSSLNSSD